MCSFGRCVLCANHGHVADGLIISIPLRSLVHWYFVAVCHGCHGCHGILKDDLPSVDGPNPAPVGIGS